MQSLKFDALRANDIDRDGDDNVNVDDDDNNSVRVMNSTHRHGHCYDLLEDSLLSMIHERMPSPRTDSYAESYSPTLGRYFRMYSHSGRNIRKEQNESDDDAVLLMGQEAIELSPFHDMGDWQQRKSSSSFSLFGDDDASNNGPTKNIGSNDSLNIGSMFLQHVKQSISNRLLGGGDDEIFKRNETTVKERANSSSSSSEEEWDRRPPTTYLQLFDMYGDAHDASSDDEVKDEPAMDDWLMYVDQMHSRESRSG